MQMLPQWLLFLSMETLPSTQVLAEQDPEVLPIESTSNCTATATVIE